MFVGRSSFRKKESLPNPPAAEERAPDSPPDKVGIAFGQFRLHPETAQGNKEILSILLSCQPNLCLLL
jgi:hypothetical protein